MNCLQYSLCKDYSTSWT